MERLRRTDVGATTSTDGEPGSRSNSRPDHVNGHAVGKEPCGPLGDGYRLAPLRLDYNPLVVNERYLRLYSGVVYDACEHLGLSGRAMSGGMYPLVHTMKVAGPAFTVHCISTPSRDERIHNIRLGMLRSMTPGCVQIRDTQGNCNCGQFGEISATAARAAGCVGAVIDGSTRDSNRLIEMEFPTFCRFRNPVEAFGRFMAVDYQVPICVQGIDGQLVVYPGDYLFGDNDGVVIVPKAKTMAVLKQAEEWFESEARSRADMASGIDPFEVYEKHGRF
ncbi:MAG TPA: RraA family protein [Thermoguttaceae bacterium]|nr:RraA family protein [Thermoguttaceae bacterium]